MTHIRELINSLDLPEGKPLPSSRELHRLVTRWDGAHSRQLLQRSDLHGIPEAWRVVPTTRIERPRWLRWLPVVAVVVWVLGVGR